MNLFKYKYLFSALAIVTGLSSCKQTVETPPNILLILTDDQGWGDLGVHGNDSINTPVIDNLCSESTSFNRFYVSSVSAPTRASLLTGRYHLRTGTSWVTHRNEVMRADETTLAEIFKSNGYETGCFGKWHNGGQFPNTPNGQGFDEFYGFLNGHLNNYFNSSLVHNNKQVKSDGYIADVIVDKAIDFMQNVKAPFLCYVPLNTPHSPFQVADKYFDKYKAMGHSDKNSAIYGMCENIDDNVGRMLYTLDSLGITENTIVIFMSDNGPNGHRYNGGMKGIKASVDEGGMRVPMFIRYPKQISAGKLIKQMAAHIDVLPTLADFCNIKLPDSIQLDGRSLKPLIMEDAPQWSDRQLFMHHVTGKFAKTPGAVRTQSHLLTITPFDTSLYNLETDPLQKIDLLNQIPQLTQKLLSDYDKWFNDVTSKGVSPVPIPIGYKENPVVHLEAPDAQLEGEITFKGGEGWSNDWIINWKSPEDKAIWEVDAIEAGEYEISMQCNCSIANEGSTMAVEINGHLLRVTIDSSSEISVVPSPDRIVRTEVYEKKWNTILLGKLNIPKGKQKVKFVSQELINENNIEIKSIILKKSKYVRF